MWIFTKDGFLSIVQYDNKPDILLVRSRFKGHIEKIFGINTQKINGSDYEYRAIIPKAEVSEVIAQLLNDIDYGNFKDELLSRNDSFYTHGCFNVYEALVESTRDKNINYGRKGYTNLEQV